MDTSLGAKGLIIKEKEILVLIELDGKLDFPGGLAHSLGGSAMSIPPVTGRLWTALIIRT